MIQFIQLYAGFSMEMLKDYFCGVSGTLGSAGADFPENFSLYARKWATTPETFSLCSASSLSSRSLALPSFVKTES